MATLALILQAATKQQHGNHVAKLLALAKADSVLLSVAFARASGVNAIADALRPVAKQTVVFVGIRNDITSFQALDRLLALGVTLYVVDTGTRHVIFHPKLYIAKSPTVADAIIGSANLTFGGLHNNIEVSSRVQLDLSNAPDADFVEQVFSSFRALPKVHPEHVLEVKNSATVRDLFESGRLVDEALVKAPNVSEAVKKGARDKLLPMKLFKSAPPVADAKKAKAAAVPKAAVPPKAAAVGPAAMPVASAVPYLVWQSKGLTERDLNIPKAKGTNPTGSMGFKQGAFGGMDHRHYFRDDVFDGLTWTPTWPGSKREMAQARFDLVIKNLNYGEFTLSISHNGDTTTRSYIQHNMTTHLHWGNAKAHVAQADLLGRTLFLYRKDTAPPTYTIEID